MLNTIKPTPPWLTGLVSLVGTSFILGGMLLHNVSYAQTGLTPTVKNAYDVPVLHPPIPILDEQGNSVLNSGNPYSPKKSCEGGGCHDYEKITHAFHFEMGRDEADDNYGKKRGIPHLVSPGYFGGYNCMGANSPSMTSPKNNATVNGFLDYAGPDMIKACATCHMGGGYEEKDRDGIRYDKKNLADIKPFDGDYNSIQPWIPPVDGKPLAANAYDTVIKPYDWKKSGVMEADCITCHVAYSDLRKFPASGLGKQDLSDKSKSAMVDWNYLRDKVIKADFLREAATTILQFVNLKPDDPNGLQLVSFETKNFTITPAADTFDFVLGANGRPKLTWNPKAFDANGRVTIPMMRFTPQEDCMECHLTANSRRGFYGFGNQARMTPDPNNGGTYLNDYYDDVHKSTNFTESNGETRALENCNGCHAKNYYHPPYQSPELSLDHNFLKGNSDMDLRNDLDYGPNAKSCAYCHKDIADPVIPSGHKTLVGAHQDAWTNSGYMAGYPADTLTKVTQTHLDVVACETCHIVGLQTSTTAKLQPLFRYKKQEDGVSRIAPYNSNIRSLWRDKKGDKVLSTYEQKMVYKDVPAAAGQPVTQAQIINVLDGSVLATIGKTGAAYNAPSTYEQFVALKTAYDKLMVKRGFPGTDMQLVYGEANMYTLNHGTRPAIQALPCAQCHEKNQKGAFSAALSDNGVFGKNYVKSFTPFTLPDARLVKEGYIRFDQPYIKLSSKNTNPIQLDINAADVLVATNVDPFMSIAKLSSAPTVTGELKSNTLSKALGAIGVADDPYGQALSALYGQNQVYYFKNPDGADALQEVAVVGLGGGIADAVLPQYRFTMDLVANLPSSVSDLLESKVPGSKLSSDAFLFTAKDQDKQPVKQFFSPVFVKIPYKGTATDAAGIKVLTSLDGSTITQLDAKDIINVRPNDATSATSSLFNFANVQALPTTGYIIFKTSQFGWFAILDVKK